MNTALIIGVVACFLNMVMAAWNHDLHSAAGWFVAFLWGLNLLK